MFNKILSYKTDIQTRFIYNEDKINDLNHQIIKLIRKDLHTESKLNSEGNIYFETDFWRRKMFHPEVEFFNLTIDAGLIQIENRDNKFGMRIEVSFLRLLIMLYAISFLAILVGVIYTDWNLFSILTLALIIGPILIVYPLSIIGTRIFISKLEELK